VPEIVEMEAFLLHCIGIEFRTLKSGYLWFYSILRSCFLKNFFFFKKHLGLKSFYHFNTLVLFENILFGYFVIK